QVTVTTFGDARENGSKPRERERELSRFNGETLHSGSKFKLPSLTPVDFSAISIRCDFAAARQKDERIESIDGRSMPRRRLIHLVIVVFPAFLLRGIIQPYRCDFTLGRE
ncbi:hypothetical protein LINPERHAP1_LOCUS34237, partial [Linum perenne]